MNAVRKPEYVYKVPPNRQPQRRNPPRKTARTTPKVQVKNGTGHQMRKTSQPKQLSQKKVKKTQKSRALKSVAAIKTKTIEYIRFDTQPYRIPKHILFSILLIFAMGVGMAATLAYLQHMRFEIGRTRTAIQSQQDENLRTQAEITRHFTVEEIAEIAQTRLNMHPPDISQIIHISVPRESYVVQSAAPAVQETQNVLQLLWYQIRNWLGV
ncbi:MAG: hypothetical protein FWG68_10495 [Defluviitaleaceae bacterium]|nr:hypothetical protein [Defluviitaleaceae bacterium]